MSEDNFWGTTERPAWHDPERFGSDESDESDESAALSESRAQLEDTSPVVKAALEESDSDARAVVVDMGNGDAVRLTDPPVGEDAPRIEHVSAEQAALSAVTSIPLAEFNQSGEYELRNDDGEMQLLRPYNA